MIVNVATIILAAGLVAILLMALLGWRFSKYAEREDERHAVRLCGQCQRFFQEHSSPADLSEADTAPRAVVAIPDHPRH